jgi:CDP-glucose 4,6-dehydratase
VKQEFWSDKRVFVTGHTGFKGSWLCLLLERLGANVLGYSLAPLTTPSLSAVTGRDGGVATVIADIRDLPSLTAAMNSFEPDIVFHLAAQSLVPDGYERPIETFEVNVQGTVNVLEAIRATPSVGSAVIVTSDKCYDNTDLERGYIESDPLGGSDPYSCSKACAELVSDAYRTSFLGEAGIGVATARAGNVLGGGDWSSNRLIPDVVRAAESGERLRLRNASATRPWQHVLDPLRGYVMLAEHLHAEPITYSGAWNFGPDPADVQPVREVVDRLMTLFGTDLAVEVVAAPYKEHTLLLLDASKAHSELGWRPLIDLDHTLASIVAWHRDFAAGQNARDLCLREVTALLKESAVE